MKFVLPFSILVWLGSQVSWRTEVTQHPLFGVAMESAGQPFTPNDAPVRPAAAPRSDFAPRLLFLTWACGFVVIQARWVRRWTQMRAELTGARAVNTEFLIPVKSSATLREPGVFGIFRPVLLFPEGLTEKLTAAQLQAILAHELCHVRRRDNLAMAIHATVQALCWFHPLVWWIGVRLVEERERACDEDVLARGNDPETYAEGILSVCKLHLASPRMRGRSIRIESESKN